MYNEYEIRPMPLSVSHCHRQVASFLQKNALRLDDIDYYACVFRLGDDEEILAGGGLKDNVIKCIAVDDALREEGFASRLISHLISEASTRGYESVDVFTKPTNRDIFESLGFTLIAQAPKAVLMEYGRGLRNYCHYLSGKRRMGRSGIIVMNANPFTRGHRYLIEQACQKVEWLHVIVVREDASEFPYEERLAMITDGTRDLTNVSIIQGSRYIISSATFPTYFIKKVSDATDTQIALDLDLFTHFIAPHLGANVRFVGSEPTDTLTSRYNHLMKELLPQKGYEVVEIERLTSDTAVPPPAPHASSLVCQLPTISLQTISASQLRKHLHEGNLPAAARLAHPTTIPYLLAHLAASALQKELNTTPKPGLVDCHDNGAHKDMNYPLMQRSINTLRKWFRKLCTNNAAATFSNIKQIGCEAESDLSFATNGINTHKGALFALGLASVVGFQLLKSDGFVDEKKLQSGIGDLARQFPNSIGTHGAEVRKKYGIGGALDSARQGYPLLFSEWLPLYRSLRGNPYQCHLTLLCIMSTLDDTNIYHRKGADTVSLVKERSNRLFQQATTNQLPATFLSDELTDMNRWFVDENISPGGSADMLSLTIFVASICGES